MYPTHRCSAALIALFAASCAHGQVPPASVGAPSPEVSSHASAPHINDYETQVLAAQSYVDSGRASEAVAMAQQAAQSAPQRWETYLVLGRAYAQMDNLVLSAEAYERARRKGCTDLALWAELASVYDVSRAFDKAVKVYEDHLSRHPDDASMRAELGVTCLLLDRVDDAVAALQQAAQTLPEDIQIRQDLGYALLRAHRFHEAVQILHDVVSLEPRRFEARRFEAEAWAGTGAGDRALEILSAILQEAPRDRPARLARARLLVKGTQWAAAQQDYAFLVSVAPDDGAAHLGAAGAYIAQKQLGAAQQAVNRARHALGDIPWVTFRQAQIDWRRGKAAALEAIKHVAQGAANPAEAREAWQDLATGAAHLRKKTLEQQAKHALGGDV